MGSNHMHDHFRRSREEEEEETDLDKLNEFLIEISNAEKMGIRRKIIAIREYLDGIGNKEV